MYFGVNMTHWQQILFLKTVVRILPSSENESIITQNENQFYTAKYSNFALIKIKNPILRYSKWNSNFTLPKMRIQNLVLSFSRWKSILNCPEWKSNFALLKMKFQFYRTQTENPIYIIRVENQFYITLNEISILHLSKWVFNYAVSLLELKYQSLKEVGALTFGCHYVIVKF